MFNNFFMDRRAIRRLARRGGVKRLVRSLLYGFQGLGELSGTFDLAGARWGEPVAE